MRYKTTNKGNIVNSIILADDHLPFRREMRKIIDEIPGIEVVGEAGDGPELFRLLESFQPDTVILDISMPGLRAMEATRRIKEKYPRVRVLILVLDEEIEYLTEGQAAGAEAVLLKQNVATDIPGALERLRQGKRSFLPRDKAEQLLLQ